MAVTTTISNHYLAQKATKKMDLENDTLKAVLVSGEFTFDRDNHSTYADISGSLLPFTGGHTAVTLSGVTKTVDDSNDRVDFTYDDVEWTASGETLESRGSIFYDDTTADDTVIGYVDFGEKKTILDEKTLTISSPILRDRS